MITVLTNLLRAVLEEASRPQTDFEQALAGAARDRRRARTR